METSFQRIPVVSLRRFFCVLLSAVLFPGVMMAQKEFTSTSPKAQNALRMAARYYDARQNTKALEELDKAISADPDFIEAYMLRANIYSDIREYTKAIAAYKEAILINPDFFPNNYYSLAKAEFLLGNYRDARSHYEKYLSYPKIPDGLASNARQMMDNCLFAEQAIKNPVPVHPVNMGPEINTADEEYFPAITADGKTLLFTRRMKTTLGGRATLQEDFYTSTKTPSGWSKAVPLKEINTAGNEGAPALSADGQYLFFTACAELFSDADAYKTNGSCDIFIAKKVGDKFMKARNLQPPVNTGTWESQPSFSSDGRTLYFVRKVKEKDGRSQRDIFVTRINDNSEWSEPEPLSNKINTPKDEFSVFIHPDDQTLYFSSEGHTGMGGFDIFFSRRQPDGEWGDPVNLGYPINTSGDENSLLVSPTGETAFFASDRPEGYGQLDLYQFTLPEQFRPRPVTYMKGKVFDAETKEPLAASFVLIDLVTGKTVVSSTSNPGNGEFLVCLPTGKGYALNVSKDGYLFYSENFELKNPKAAYDPFLKDVPLKPIRAGQSVVLNNVFFDFDKYDLKDESRVELTKLMDFLAKNPSVHIELSGHTDNVGGKGYNQTLSENRAKAVYDYLIKNGVSENRLQYKGYGDTKPVADNTSDSGRSQNRRTEFTVTSVH
ncbi:MAG: PD40 domain-containing protein [Bacteroidia bacterium]|nr:PD40 domain-containing protein [Bacteroidia bacterium]